MSPLLVSVLSFLAFIVSSLAGLCLAHSLPETQLTDRNRDLIKEVRRMLVTLASLTLGLIIASATTSFDQRNNEVEDSGSKIIALESTLSNYGPNAHESREILRDIVKRGIERLEIAADEGFNTEKTRKGIGINTLQLELLQLAPRNERETWLRSMALGLANDLGSYRWLKHSGSVGRIQWPFLAILIFWLCGVFVSYGAVASHNATAVGAMTVVALCMAMAIDLTLDLDTPNRGLIRMSAAPLHMALEQIGPLEPPPAAEAQSPPRTQIVNTDRGPVQGVIRNGVTEFRGIPFAAAPTGALRWADPQMPNGWTRTFDATNFGGACPQVARFNLTEASNNENCLTINVSMPSDRRPGEKLPVIFWVHGGAFVGGASSLYRLDWLAAKRVVVVSSNYRLGALGFMSHPDFPPTTNGALGLVDQRFAMGWVQRNIAAFGGDQNNVMLMGESAGGAASCIHVAAPEGLTGLFHKASIHSAGCLFPMKTVQEGFAVGLQVEAFIRQQLKGNPQYDCTNLSALKCLQQAPIQTLLDAQTAVADADMTAFVPKIGSTIAAPRSFANALKSGKVMKVPMLFGGTHDEVNLYVGYDQQACFTNPNYCTTYANFGTWLSKLYPKNGVAAAIWNEYGAQNLNASSPPSAAPALRGKIMSDFTTLLGLNNCLYLHTAQSIQYVVPSQPIYRWEFTDKNALVLGVGIPATPNPGFPMGAAHSSELNYFFPNFDNTTKVSGPNLGPQSQQLAEKMLNYWTSFARNGFPTSDGAPVWSTSPHPETTVMRLDPVALGQYNSQVEHRCVFWKALYPEFLSPRR